MISGSFGLGSCFLVMKNSRKPSCNVNTEMFLATRICWLQGSARLAVRATSNKDFSSNIHNTKMQYQYVFKSPLSSVLCDLLVNTKAILQAGIPKVVGRFTAAMLRTRRICCENQELILSWLYLGKLDSSPILSSVR